MRRILFALVAVLLAGIAAEPAQARCGRRAARQCQSAACSTCFNGCSSCFTPACGPSGCGGVQYAAPTGWQPAPSERTILALPALGAPIGGCPGGRCR